MNKDVIYIDVEDDITAIIGKVKDAKEKIVALVPPKRVGVLQSAVNLRLLARTATQTDKRLVLITNNTALTALAAAAKIPIAKNLQSKPELVEIAALDIDNGDDIIDGAQLPIGEHAGIATANEATPLRDIPKAAPPLVNAPLVKPRIKSGSKVPNFNTFRKKLIFGIGGGVLLVSFLVWAIFFAPRATVIITARTTDSSANAPVVMDPAAVTSLATNSLKTVLQQTKKDSALEFEATGSKEVGEKAKGKITLNRTSVSSNSITVPAGTSFSSASITFVSTEAATLNGTTVGPGGIVQDSATVGVIAVAVGEEYNLSARAYQSSVSGISAQGTDMAGGSKRQIKVVSNDDVQKAVDQLAQASSDEMKAQLKKQFDDTFTVLDPTFKVDRGAPQVTPAVDQEVVAGTKPKLTVSVNYSLAGLAKADIGKFLDEYFAKQLEGTQNQSVYENGAQKATFANITSNGGGFTGNLVASAKIGPKVDNAVIKESAKGKRYGDIQSSIESIQGVDNVDVKFWPFWVSAAPDDINRISVEFNLNESK